jgi:hypothetical protein
MSDSIEASVGSSYEDVEPVKKGKQRVIRYKQRIVDSYSSDDEESSIISSSDEEMSEESYEKTPKRPIYKKPAKDETSNFDDNNKKMFDLLQATYMCTHNMYQRKKTGKTIFLSFDKRTGECNCDTLIAIADNIINNKNTIQEKNIKDFYKLMMTNHYPKKSYAYHNPEKIINITNKIMKHHILPFDALNFLINDSKFDQCLKYIVENPKFGEHSDEYFKYIIKKRLILSRDNEKDNTLCNFVMENININPDNLAVLCSCANTIIIQKLLQIMDRFEGDNFKALINENFVEIAYKNLPYTIDVIKTLINKNIQIKNDDFELICKHGNYEHIKTILEMTRIPITNSHFKAIFEQTTKGIILAKKVGPIKKNRNNNLDLLFKYGYELKKSDILFTIEKNFEIENIERFGIELDDAVYKHCIKHEFFPKYKFSCISPEMIQLHDACYNKKLPLVKKLIKDNNLVPDDYCMEIISLHRESKIFEFLIKKGGKVNIQCIKNVAESYGSNHYILQYINEYEKENNNNVLQLKKKIEELENNNNLFQLKNKIDESENSMKPADNNVVDHPKNENVVIENSNIKKDIMVLNVDNNKIIEYRQKYKNKRNPHKKMVEFFGIDAKQKISYADFKKLLFDKIINESWLCKDDKTLITVPAKYGKLFGFGDTDTIIKFDDVENLIYLFYLTNCE